MKIEKVCEDRQCLALAECDKICFLDEAWSAETFCALLAASIRHGYLLFDDDSIVGYVIITSCEGDAEIERIGILPAYRCLHHGRNLLMHVLDLLSVNRCVLEVNALNDHAKRMYASCGFEIFGKRTAYYRGGVDALMMEWKRKNE